MTQTYLIQLNSGANAFDEVANVLNIWTFRVPCEPDAHNTRRVQQHSNHSCLISAF